MVPLTGETLMKAMEVFFAIDKDGSGTLDAAEIREGFEDAVKSQGLEPMFVALDDTVRQMMHLGESKSFDFQEFFIILSVCEAQ